MTLYKTNRTTELWTKIGSRTNLKPPIGTLLEISMPFWIKERDLQCWLIAARADGTPYSGDYINKCVEQTACELYAPEEPPTVPPTPDRATFEWLNSAGEVIITETWAKQ
jgi:hypothetical protein